MKSYYIYYMLYSVFKKLMCYIKIMEIVNICFNNEEYYLDKEKLLYIINLLKNIEHNEKSIYKMLKRRKLLDKTFLNKLNVA